MNSIKKQVGYRIDKRYRTAKANDFRTVRNHRMRSDVKSGHQTFHAANSSVLLWFLATYVIWIPLDIISNRVTFVYYFLSTTPAICIGITIAITDWLNYLKKRKTQLNRLTTGVALAYSLIGVYLFLHLAIFIFFNPAIPPIIKTWLPPFHIP